MPAVTVSDITVLPRVSEVPGAQARKSEEHYDRAARF